MQDALPGRVPWARLSLGTVLVFVAFDRVGAALGSPRGEAGGLLALLVLTLLVAIEALVFGRPLPAALRALGLGRPAVRGLATGLALAATLAALLPVCARAAGVPLVMLPSWPVLLAGIFLQHGVAEEALFRGFLFGEVRRHHAFWPAAWRAMLPFAAAHAWLFLLMPVPVAAAATGLAVASAFPLSRLYDDGRRTIWGPALLHTAINSVKLLDLGGEGRAAVFAASWMACAAVVPFLAFVVPARRQRRPQVI